MSYAVKRQYPASEGATQPRDKGARLERMNLQVQTKTQSRFSATPFFVTAEMFVELAVLAIGLPDEPAHVAVPNR